MDKSGFSSRIKCFEHWLFSAQFFAIAKRSGGGDGSACLALSREMLRSETSAKAPLERPLYGKGRAKEFLPLSRVTRQNSRKVKEFREPRRRLRRHGGNGASLV